MKASPLLPPPPRFRHCRICVPAIAVSAAAAAIAAFASAAPVNAAGIALSSRFDPPPPQKTAPKKEEAKKEDSEIKMGREAHDEMVRNGLKLVKDPEAQARIETIGKKIAAIVNDTKLPVSYGSANLVPYDYKFFIVDDSDVNAFSLPGGYIYINKGLLKYVQSDEELAGVLGHEIIHAAHHHVAKLEREQSRLNTQMLAVALGALLMKVPTNDALNVFQGFQLIALQKVNGFGQNAERDADYAGLIAAHKAGYNPVGMLTFMERLERDQKMRPEVELGIFRTHPPEAERVASITKEIQTLGLPINRRAVTNILKVTVKPTAMVQGMTAYDVLLENRSVFRTASETRAKLVSETLDRMLNSSVEVFEVKRTGATVTIKGETLVTVAPDDVVLPGSKSPEETAEGVNKAVRLALYRRSIESNL